MKQNFFNECTNDKFEQHQKLRERFSYIERNDQKKIVFEFTVLYELIDLIRDIRNIIYYVKAFDLFDRNKKLSEIENMRVKEAKAQLNFIHKYLIRLSSSLSSDEARYKIHTYNLDEFRFFSKEELEWLELKRGTGQNRCLYDLAEDDINTIKERYDFLLIF